MTYNHNKAKADWDRYMKDVYRRHEEEKTLHAQIVKNIEKDLRGLGNNDRIPINNQFIKSTT